MFSTRDINNGIWRVYLILITKSYILLKIALTGQYYLYTICLLYICCFGACTLTEVETDTDACFEGGGWCDKWSQNIGFCHYYYGWLSHKMLVHQERRDGSYVYKMYSKASKDISDAQSSKHHLLRAQGSSTIHLMITSFNSLLVSIFPRFVFL